MNWSFRRYFMPPSPTIAPAEVEFRQVVNLAADLIDKHGLSHGASHDGDSMCIGAALVEAQMKLGLLTSTDWDRGHFRTLAGRLPKTFKWASPGANIVFFSDRNSKEVVVATLREIAR